ncbi:MAG: hypothetical protein AXA67_01065 [Methylothermaceae bacteria B42]|nr:MAG: hypothetical protein AXA67_01065 [Methylothermaceae bacteria B42]HHJ40468.1 formate dehydrogenase [Methylothermaceae bacterium]
MADLNPEKVNRRGFFRRLAGLTVGGVGLTALAGKAEPSNTPPLLEKKKQGYQATEHIKKYYDTARD